VRGFHIVAAASLLAWTPLHAEPVLLISIDGLRPGDMIEAEKRGLKIPNLRRFVAEGAYASGVVGVLPTVTYPSHVTLLTGASPAKHGVVSNTTFDPRQINHGGWYWYASDIKLPTLWSVAAASGKTVGNVHWPVSVAATGVTWNLPQIWRTGHGDDAKLLTALATPGLVAELERSTGETYAPGIDESIDGDEKRGRFAVKLIEAHKPEFLTAYLTALDHEQHAEGPGTAQAHAVLERIDAIVGRLVAAELAAHPDAAIAIVSDHGFETITRETSFFRAFIDAGLIQLDGKGAITAWDAMPWPTGGSVAIVLARKDDAALEKRVRTLLDGMKADQANGIAAIAGKAEIAKMGGNPDATFFINLQPDTSAAGFAGAAGPLRGTPKYKGTHGYFPQAANLRATFLIMGKGIAPNTSLGEIDMRAIAPTIASIMKLELQGAEVAPISLAAKSRR
jgi:predicted AlkP superfamily pyrophosphatase or phosphodiesterase